jgi:secondary thiamine-phosphate synthase enzyme
MSMIHKISLNTRSRVEFIDITGKVRDIIADSGVISGICYIYVPHTTAAVMINEHADPDVVEDIAAHLDLMVPQRGNYRHSEGNSAAHIKASIIGESNTVFIEYGEPALGTWQGIFFCEFDGPRNRSVTVKITAEK